MRLGLTALIGTLALGLLLAGCGEENQGPVPTKDSFKKTAPPPGYRGPGQPGGPPNAAPPGPPGGKAPTGPANGAGSTGSG